MKRMNIMRYIYKTGSGMISLWAMVDEWYNHWENWEIQKESTNDEVIDVYELKRL